MSIATAALPADFARHWVKRLARAMGVPQETARHWAFRRMPDTRRKEIAHALIAECDRLEAVIHETRRRWEEVADEADHERRDGAASGPAPAGARGKADRNGSLVR